MVVRNFTDGFGVPWQQAFNTDDRAAVEAYCARNGIDRVDRRTGLRTRAAAGPCTSHPVTGETVWFNHLDLLPRHHARPRGLRRAAGDV